MITAGVFVCFRVAVPASMLKQIICPNECDLPTALRFRVTCIDQSNFRSFETNYKLSLQIRAEERAQLVEFVSR